MKHIHLSLLMLAALASYTTQDVYAITITRTGYYHVTTILSASSTLGFAIAAIRAHYQIKRLCNLSEHEKNDPEIKKKLEELKKTKKGSIILACIGAVCTCLWKWNGDLSMQRDFKHEEQEKELLRKQQERWDREEQLEREQRAHNELALEYHPDKNKSASAHTTMIRINEAYEVLMQSSTAK